MLVIREAQMKILSDGQVARFVDEWASHIREFLPDHFDALGEAGVRAVIRAGIAIGRSYGFVSEDCAASFIRLMFLFGEDFHQTQDWAAAILHKDRSAFPERALLEREKAAALAEAAVAHLGRLALR